MSRNEADKGRLVKALHAQRVLLEVILEQLTPEQMLSPGVDASLSAMTVKDVIAHLTAWDKRGTAWIRAAARGEMPEMPEPGKTWADLDALNAQTYAESRERPLDDVLKAFAAAYPPLLEAAQAFPESEIARPITFFNGTHMQTIPAGRLIAWRYRHYREHGEQIRQWIKRQGS